jgi:hypothetical protein
LPKAFSKWHRSDLYTSRASLNFASASQQGPSWRSQTSTNIPRHAPIPRGSGPTDHSCPTPSRRGATVGRAAQTQTPFTTGYQGMHQASLKLDDIFEAANAEPDIMLSWQKRYPNKKNTYSSRYRSCNVRTQPRLGDAYPSIFPDWIRRRETTTHFALEHPQPTPASFVLCPSAPPHMQALTLHVASRMCGRRRLLAHKASPSSASNPFR